MQRSYLLPKLSVHIFLASQFFSASAAFAAGFQINETSPGLQGAALAGAAVAQNDVSAMYINPATLSTLDGRQFYIGASEIMPTISVSKARAIHSTFVPVPPFMITAPVQGRTSQGNISKNILIPTGSLGWRINDKLVAGLSIVAPFGLDTKYYNGSVLRFAALYSSVDTIALNPALAYTINNNWSVGAGFIAQHMHATFSNFNGPYTGISFIDNAIAANNPTHLKADGWGYGYNLGAMFQPNSTTRIGLGYRSQISESLSGNGQQFVTSGGVTPPPPFPAPFNAQTSVRAATKTPAILTLSAARDINDWTIKASAQLNFWNSFNHLSIYMPNAFATNSTIRAKWNNTLFAALGADYRIHSAWTIRGGVAYDQTPTNDQHREPRIPDTDRIWATLGATYAYNKHLSLDGAYEHIFMMNQTVNFSQSSGTNSFIPVPLETNTVYAKYKASVNIFALALRYNF